MSILCSDHTNSSTVTEHYRKIFRFGFHPTATRAAMLLRISTSCISSQGCEPTGHEYLLCPFTTEDVLSFCVDTAQVLVVDITDENGPSETGEARTCLVVDGNYQNEHLASTAWSATSPPQHFVFASMPYDRAIGWVRKWVANDTVNKLGVSLDMQDTYSDDTDNINCGGDAELVELTLPCTISATRTSDPFLHYCTRLTHIGMSSLANVTQIGDDFLRGCSALTSLDLSPLSNVSEIGSFFLCGCAGLLSLDLSPLAYVNLSVIEGFFLCGCAVDLSPLAHVSRIEGFFLSQCAALTSLDLSTLKRELCWRVFSFSLLSVNLAGSIAAQECERDR
eukprot:PhM_4_TR15703/c4_g3_i1/m.85061